MVIVSEEEIIKDLEKISLEIDESKHKNIEIDEKNIKNTVHGNKYQDYFIKKYKLINGYKWNNYKWDGFINISLPIEIKYKKAKLKTDKSGKQFLEYGNITFNNFEALHNVQNDFILHIAYYLTKNPSKEIYEIQYTDTLYIEKDKWNELFDKAAKDIVKKHLYLKEKIRNTKNKEKEEYKKELEKHGYDSKKKWNGNGYMFGLDYTKNREYWTFYITNNNFKKLKNKFKNYEIK